MRIHYPLSYKMAIALMVLLVAPCQAAQFKATLQWAKRVELGLPDSGVVLHVFAEVGQKVSKGGKLLQLDNTVFKVDVKQAKSILQSDEAAYKEAEREMHRSVELYNRTVLSDHDLQVAKDNKIAAQAKRDTALANLVKARQKLKYSTLRAPFNALVLQRNAQVGQVIAAKLKPVTLFVVADADHMIARMDVGENRLNQFKLGQSVKVMLGSSQVPGVIKAIGFEPIKDKGQDSVYPVDVEFNTAGRVLRAGLHVMVELP